MERDAKYETTGVLFVTPTMTGATGLIGLNYADYEKLMALGLMESEVDLTIRKAEYGSEYSQQVPQCRMKAGLYTIKMNASIPRPQLDIGCAAIEEVRKRGFRDGEKLAVTIEQLPYKIPREGRYEGLKLDVDL